MKIQKVRTDYSSATAWCNSKGNKCELEKLAIDRGLPLEEEVQKIDHGWEGK